MSDATDLAKAVEQALAVISSEADVREAEVFAASNRALLTRLNYTSHIPCNGVEEPKSTEMHGLGVQVAFDAPGGVTIGFGSEPSDLSVEGARRALDKARRAAVHDPEWRSLPRAASEAANARRLPRPPAPRDLRRPTGRGGVEGHHRRPANLHGVVEARQTSSRAKRTSSASASSWAVTSPSCRNGWRSPRPPCRARRPMNPR